VTDAKERLVIPQEIRDGIVAHARDHAPRECCGIVSGTTGNPTHLHPLTNVEPGNTRYLFDDEEFYRVYREIQNAGEDLIVVYHSHPATQAWPSPTDVANATWPEAVYAICSLEQPDEPVLRGFRIIDGQISEVELA
jgi:proteasome lid subunit RPN8/RPN11